jgi:hypothetical protein
VAPDKAEVLSKSILAFSIDLTLSSKTFESISINPMLFFEYYPSSKPYSEINSIACLLA